MKENTFVRKNLRAERHDVCNSPKSFWKEPDVQGGEEGTKQMSQNAGDLGGHLCEGEHRHFLRGVERSFPGFKFISK